MKQVILSDKFVAELIEVIKTFKDKEKVYQYIQKVANTAKALCDKGEYLYALNEYKFLFQNLQEQFNFQNG